MTKITETAVRVTLVRSFETLKFFSEEIVAQYPEMMAAGTRIRSKFHQEDSELVVASLRPPAFPSLQARIRAALTGGIRQGRLRGPHATLRLAAADNTNNRI